MPRPGKHISSAFIGTINQKFGRLTIRCYCRCDRIIWFGEGMKQTQYARGESSLSDHRPVRAIFTADIKVIGIRRWFKEQYSEAISSKRFEFHYSISRTRFQVSRKAFTWWLNSLRDVIILPTRISLCKIFCSLNQIDIMEKIVRAKLSIYTFFSSLYNLNMWLIKIGSVARH